MIPSNKIKVLIADDHAIMRAGLRQILEESGKIMVSADAESGLEAIRLHRLKPADVLLLDHSSSPSNSLDILKHIKGEFPRLAVLMLSLHHEDHYAIRTLKAGASGYLSKRCGPADIIHAIGEVAAGRKYISAALAQELANQLVGNHDKPLHACLSDREYQTLIMIASGKSVSDVAAELALSVKTVSMYRSRLLEKLNLRHNAELTHYAMKNNLV
jgi:two-component system invasion response regulator UvrY